MSGFYSLNTRARDGIRRVASPPLPDPFSPTSPDFAERNRETSRKLPSGLVVVTLGKPTKN